MTKKKYCSGCGVVLQDENVAIEGYVQNIENDICQRCFRMKNYGEYQMVTKSNEEYLDILKGVGETKDLVLYITDLLNLERNIETIRSLIPNKMILVLNKKDVLPKSVKETKLIKYLESKDVFFEEVIVISANKNYNIDYLLKRIKFYQTSKNVYVVGHTNAGKSSLINKLIKNYSDKTQELTMSPLPSTTLNTLTIEINDYLTSEELDRYLKSLDDTSSELFVRFPILKDIIESNPSVTNLISFKRIAGFYSQKLARC